MYFGLLKNISIAESNDCALFLKMIADTKSAEKNRIQDLLDSHRLDAEMCQDFMFWMFQKAYMQMGRSYQDCTSLQTHGEGIH